MWARIGRAFLAAARYAFSHQAEVVAAIDAAKKVVDGVKAAQ